MFIKRAIPVHDLPAGSIPKTVRNDFRMFQLVISKTRYEETVSQTVSSGNGPYMAPCLHGALLHGFLHLTIGSPKNAWGLHAITV